MNSKILFGILALGFFSTLTSSNNAIADEVRRTGQVSSHSGANPVIAAPPYFTDVTAEAQLEFVHSNGMTGERYYPEIMGSGVALFDYDADGDLDLYLVQGYRLESGRDHLNAVHPDPAGDRLFRNDLELSDTGHHRPRFTDVTKESGIVALGYGMGVAAGDFDNDGWVDLYVTNFGPNQLFRNMGKDRDGKVRFADVTEAAGTTETRWSVSASFVDYDHDGWLDLYVGNYLNFNLANHKPCQSGDGRWEEYCGPVSYVGEPDALFHNNGPDSSGQVSFSDVSGASGIGGHPAASLGAVAADFNRDGWIDLYVANDQDRNHLWINQGDGRFTDDALLAGCAVNGEGVKEASMGVSAADFDLDGDEDLFLTHLEGQTNTLFVNDGSGLFEDATPGSGLGRPSFSNTSFGTGFIDFDNDGYLDLLIVNGTVKALESQVLAEDPFPYKQPNQLFRNTGRGFFEFVTERAGDAFQVSQSSRGAAFGDIDNDGDIDFVVSSDQGRARVLLNTADAKSRWIGLKLLGSGSKRDMLGARASILREDGAVLWRRVATDGSYASANDPRLIFGLGSGNQEGVRARVVWPSGSMEEWDNLPVGRYNTLREGEGETIENGIRE
jgi:hypothetical protein